MAVGFDSKSTAVVDGNSATSFTNSTNMTVGGSANALVVLMVWSVGVPTGISLTWNGVALTLISGTSVDNSCNVSLYGLLNPAPGTLALAGSWTGTRDFDAFAISFNGVNTTSFANAFNNGTTATGTSVTPTVVINSAVGNMTVAVYADNGATGFNSVNQNSLFIDNTLNNTVGAGGYASGAATVTHTVSQNVGPAPWAAAAVNVNASIPAILGAQIWM